MNILYLCQVFEVGSDAGSDRHFFFCKYAKSQGHKVSAITSNVDYKNACVKIKGESGTILRTIAGVDIHYVYSFANFRGSFIKRFFYYLTYFFSSINRAFRIKNIDIIYAVSTPLSVGLIGYVISRMRGVPFVFEVTDVWPDAPIACGVVKNKALIKLARWLEMFCYDKAAHVVGLTQGIKQNIIDKGVASQKVSTITNGVDFSLFPRENNDESQHGLRNEYGFGDRFVAMYLGAHGAYNALDTIIDAALCLRGEEQFLFVFVGDGDEKPRLQKRVSENQLANVLFLDPVPRAKSVSLLSTADAFLLPNRQGEFFLGNLPNKLFDFLASARPIIVAGAGETAELVSAAGAGKICEAEKGEEMAKALIEVAKMNENERRQMGEKGREFIKENYDRRRLSEEFLAILSRSILEK